MANADPIKSAIPPKSRSCFRDISGEKFGRLTVVEFGGRDRGGRILWKCDCTCGNVALVHTSSLRGGITKSCGCIHVERARRLRRTHGMSESPEYRCWSHMIGRCENTKDTCYQDYGGRGITVCDAWRKSFESFFEDMGERPSDKHSIERIDVNGNYCPENCKWATASEQAKNKRRHARITHNGETLTLSGWSERTGISLATIKWRYKHGFPVERILHRVTRNPAE